MVPLLRVRSVGFLPLFDSVRRSFVLMAQVLAVMLHVLPELLFGVPPTHLVSVIVPPQVAAQLGPLPVTSVLTLVIAPMHAA